LCPETVLKVEGTVVEVAQAPGGLELHQPTFTVLAIPTSPPPFELRRPSLDIQLPTLLDYAAVAWRHPRQRAVGNLGAASVAGFRSHLDDLGFLEIQTPKLVASATEGGANVFRVDYFGGDAYLAQSPQFYKQAMVGVHERVYEVGPVFRAEPHDTARHLAEYVSLDLEMGFIQDHRDVMGLLRGVLAEMVGAIEERAAAAVRLLEIPLPQIPPQIPAIDFWDAQELIELVSGEPTVGELDLAPSHERLLGDWALREHGSEFLFVVGYPMAKRPFYTHPNPLRPEFSNSFDLLFRGLELVTGGQRLHRYPDYLSALAGQDLAPYAGYLQAFQYGMPPHGGFALGLERWLARLTGASNVRAVTLFPRDLNRLSP
jgi:nondiscriminating aspartyl-tRNA synthetase